MGAFVDIGIGSGGAFLAGGLAGGGLRRGAARHPRGATIESSRSAQTARQAIQRRRSMS
jgi:hypothetical protein